MFELVRTFIESRQLRRISEANATVSTGPNRRKRPVSRPMARSKKKIVAIRDSDPQFAREKRGFWVAEGSEKRNGRQDRRIDGSFLHFLGVRHSHEGYDVAKWVDSPGCVKSGGFERLFSRLGLLRAFGSTPFARPPQPVESTPRLPLSGSQNAPFETLVPGTQEEIPLA